jgi:glutaconate CoA-transferase, subunit B
VRGAGPRVVVTNLGFLEPDESPGSDGELILTALHPGIRVEQVMENTGWPLRVAAQLRQTEPPSAEELRILRSELDPDRIYLA